MKPHLHCRCLSFLAAVIPLPSLGATLPPELDALNTQFLQLRSERVVGPFEADLAKLDRNYLMSITRKMAEEKAAGHLDGVLALEAEHQRLASKQPLPEVDDKTVPTSLQELRTIYREQVVKLTVQRTANLKALTDPLAIRLAQMEADMTKADRLTEAKIVRSYREGLAEAKGSSPTPDSSRSTKDPFTNTLGMKFVPVPGTDVLMCIHETRRKDYAAYATQNTGVDATWKNQAREGIPCGDKDDHPVVGVSWEDAQKFCGWLSKKEGRAYRLPTDQEWSAAAGIETDEKQTKNTLPESLHMRNQTAFSWGGDSLPKTNDKAGNFGDTVWRERFPGMPFIEGYTDGFVTTAPVLSFKPNKVGLHDMGGNVWEWVADWWNSQQKERVLRGGSFYSGERAILLSSYRGYQPPMKRAHDFGFRCVVDTRNQAATGTDRLTPPTLILPPPPPPATVTANKGLFTNTLGMKFVPVPTTNVMFCIHETRYKDYAAFASQFPDVDGSWKNQTSYGIRPMWTGAIHPVIRVSWEDAQKFCSWLSQKEGRTYRLPTDQEWSIAVGVGPDEKWVADTTPATVAKSKDAFPWGDAWPPLAGAGNYSDFTRSVSAPVANSQYIEGYEDGFPTTAPVMSFKPNQLGLYDLGGNVWEWVADWYNLAKQHRTFRGASYVTGHRDHLLSSYRTHNPPDYRHDNHGFRVVLEVMKP